MALGGCGWRRRLAKGSGRALGYGPDRRFDPTGAGGDCRIFRRHRPGQCRRGAAAQGDPWPEFGPRPPLQSGRSSGRRLAHFLGTAGGGPQFCRCNRPAAPGAGSSRCGLSPAAPTLKRNSLRGYSVQVSDNQIRWSEVGVLHDIEAFEETAVHFNPTWTRYVRIVIVDINSGDPTAGGRDPGLLATALRKRALLFRQCSIWAAGGAEEPSARSAGRRRSPCARK